MKYVKLFASVIVFATAAWRPAFGSSISTNGLTLVDLTTDDPDHCTGTTSGYFSGSGIQYAFNNDETLGERWALQNYRQGYVIYRFDTPTVVNGYGIWNHAGANTEPTKRAPRTWTFEASNDGESWTVLDTQPSETGWSAGQFRCYLAVNKTPYTYYKMNISNSIEKHLQVAHFEYFKLSFAELYDQFPGEVTVNAGETTLEIDYTNKILGSETVSEAWIDYGESEDALTEHAQPAETTATGIKFLISELPKYTAYSLRISFKLTGYEETFVVPVFAAHTRKAVTLVPGSATFLSGSSWDGGIVPDDYTDLHIDDDASTASAVTFAATEAKTYSYGSLEVDADDSLKLTKSVNGSAGAKFTDLVNNGTINVNGHAGNNDQATSATFTGSIVNNGTINVNGSASRNRTRTYLNLAPGFTNNGTINVIQPSSDRNNANCYIKGFGVVQNNGKIVLTLNGTYGSDNTYSRLYIDNSTANGFLSFLGSGAIIIEEGDRANSISGMPSVGAASASTTVTNGINHSIIGCGNIDKFTLVNEGLVVATGDHLRLSVQHTYMDAGGLTMVNTENGRMVAKGAAGLYVGASTTQNSRFLNYGLMEARAGSFIEFRAGLTEQNSKSTIATTVATQQRGRWAGGGEFRIPRPLTLLEGAVLAPGDLANTLAQDGETVIYGTGESTCGTLTFTNSLTLSAGTVSEFQLQGRDRFDALHVGGSLTLGGTFKVVGKPHGGTFRIITADASISGEFDAIDMSAADGAKAPKLTFGSTTVEEEVPTGETDADTGEPIMTTVSHTTYYVDAEIASGFTVIVR